MIKYILIVVVVLFGFLFIKFLMQGDFLNQQFTELGGNLAVNPNNPPATGPVKSEDKKDIKPITGDNTKKTMEITSATINTNMGSITIGFFGKDAPKTVANFLKLAQDGFYNKIKFHRVIKGFMIQAGDPLTKDDSKISIWGTGGSGYSFADEIDAKSDLYTKGGYQKGVVAMANSGPNTNGSQFFIMTESNSLPPSYTIFGKVLSGQDVVDKIANVKTVNPGVNDRPVSPVVINSITLK